MGSPLFSSVRAPPGAPLFSVYNNYTFTWSPTAYDTKGFTVSGRLDRVQWIVYAARNSLQVYVATLSGRIALYGSDSWIPFPVSVPWHSVLFCARHLGCTRTHVDCSPRAMLIGRPTPSTTKPSPYLLVSARRYVAGICSQLVLLLCFGTLQAPCTYNFAVTPWLNLNSSYYIIVVNASLPSWTLVDGVPYYGYIAWCTCYAASLAFIHTPHYACIRRSPIFVLQHHCDAHLKHQYLVPIPAIVSNGSDAGFGA
jgi:hypothetical protein